MRKRLIVLGVICLAQSWTFADVLPRLRVASSVDRSGATAAMGGSAPVVNADGQRVAFISRSQNLVTNRTGSEVNVYLRQLGESNTVLISRSLTGTGGNDHSALPTLSSNGNVVAFQSAADNLVPDDTNGASDIFLYNAADGSVRCVSTNGQGFPAAGASTFPLISEDSRYVVFESTAPDLAPDDLNGVRDVFRADVLTGEIRLVSVPGDTGPDSDSELQSITPSGRFVVFLGNYVAPGSTNRLGHVYVRDLETEITYCPTKDLQMSQYALRRFLTAITPDGRYIAFRDLNIEAAPGPAPGAGIGNVYWADVVGGSYVRLTNSINAAGAGLAISGDGSKVIFPSAYGIFLKEVSSGATRQLVDYRQPPAYPESIAAWISDCVVDPAFTRLVYIVNTNLRASALYVYDMSMQMLELVDFHPVAPVSLTPSGRFLAYEVSAARTATNDLNNAPDIYLQRFDVLPHYRSNHLVTVAHPGLREVTGSGFSTLLPNSLTAAGDRILFVSTDSSFGRDDTNYWHDLFAHDYRSNATWSAHPFRSNRTWNVHGPLVQALPPSTNFVSLSNSAHSCRVSADGNFAVFVRSTGNQLRGPTNLLHADLRTGSITDLGEGASPSLSEDGRRVAYESPAPGTTVRQVLVRDFVEPALYIASSRFDGSANANGSSWAAQITLNGQWVVFLSTATDLVESQTFPAGVPRVFARNLAKGRTRLLSLDTRGNQSNERATNFVISANGRYVILSLGTALYRHDLLASGLVTNSLVCSNCVNPSVTADGRLVLYQTGSTLLFADVEPGGAKQIASNAREGSISQDGRFVVYTSRGDVFLRDRWRGTTHLLSATPLGAPGNGPSARGFISADGRRVAFQSFASDLTAGDFNQRRDVFYVLLDAPDTDNDQMNDDWEDHYFGGLDRNGQGDFDGDGYSDAIEEQIGSNPADSGSNLRVLNTQTVRSGPSWAFQHQTTLTWQSAAAGLYRAEMTTNLHQPTHWRVSPGDIIPGGPIGTTVQMTTNPAVFYRIKRLE